MLRFLQFYITCIISILFTPHGTNIPNSIIRATTIHHRFQHDQNKINTPENHNEFSSHHVYRIKFSTFLRSNIDSTVCTQPANQPTVFYIAAIMEKSKYVNLKHIFTICVLMRINITVKVAPNWSYRCLINSCFLF